MTHAADSIHSIDPATLTPAMRQYQQYKQQYPDAVLFFRIGDFYECFYEDARTVARTLGVALTARSKGENPVPMAGVPYHAVETYLHRMVAAGFKVAICEQMESPKDAKGVIKREVTRLVTPGTLTEEAMLDGREENFLAAVITDSASTQESTLAAIAWCDLSTGKFLTFTGTLAACSDQLARLRPRELIHAEAADHRPGEWLESLRTQLNTTLSGRPAWQLDPHHAAQTLKTHYAVATFAGFGYENEKDLALRAAGGLVAYLHETQKSLLEHLQPPSAFEQSSHLLIDPVSLRSLEVLRTLRGNTVEGSLVAAIDRTSTPMGSRLLRNWLCYPLCDLAQIRKRQDAVEQLATAEATLAQIRTILADCSDIERITARICCRRASPRDLVALARSIEALMQAAKILKPTHDNEPAEIPAHNAELIALVPPAKQLADHIRCCLPDEPPAHLRDGNVIKDGCNADLDRLRALSRDSRTFLAEYQSTLIARSNISSLKVGYNKVFGFYIEVTNVHAEKIPADFIRKQTVKNAERYITPELKQYESEILTAQERSLALEQELFEQLRNHLAAQVHTLQRLAASAATLDVTAGLAHLARTRHYCRPVLTTEKILAITDGRHPVVEQSLGEKFVPNDTAFGITDETANRRNGESANAPCLADSPIRPLAASSPSTLHVITGPNMAGKSTYIRQVALLVLMAQAGSFIPAKSATLGIVDRIFTRVGAADDLAQGQSTFMVEMIETANILHHATESSLVILDEIGRGTSTLDGLALAWAIAEFLADTTKARTLFATHYHELTELAETSKAVANYNVLVREWEDQVIFMHRIAPGQADKSYGVHVARLAGVPRSVVTRARQLMTQLVVHVGKTGSRPKAASPTVAPQIGIFDPIDQQALTQLRALDMNRMSPMQAWEALRTLQGMLEERKTDRLPPSL
jgi:DNA mismatch repair protein MutS